MGGEVPRFVAGRRRRMAHDHHVLQFVPAARGRSGHPPPMIIMFCSSYLAAQGVTIRGHQVFCVVPGRRGRIAPDHHVLQFVAGLQGVIIRCAGLYLATQGVIIMCGEVFCVVSSLRGKDGP